MMRIDSSQVAQSLTESQESNTPAAANSNETAGSQTASVLGEDQAQLSGIHLQVRALVGQTLELPEVQQEKVQSLRHAINDGTYQPRAEDVAGAMFSNLAGMLAA